MAMEKTELFFIPSPLIGHVGQAIELTRLLLKHFHHLTITVLVMKHPTDPISTDYTNSLTADNQIKFIHFPPMDPHLFQHCHTVPDITESVIKRHTPIVRDVVATRFDGSDRTHLLGALVVDMFCTPMIDVAKEFNLPSYVFFTSNAAVLGTFLYFQTLEDEHGKDIYEIVRSGAELSKLTIPSYVNPVPASVVPSIIWDKDLWSKIFIRHARNYRQATGIIVNTFSELESYALQSYDDKTPPVYPVGPMLKPATPTPDNEVLKWLDGQPESSVLLLCFGSRGWFNVEQVREIAVAVERSGYQFLWSLRRPPSHEEKGFPGEYTDYNEVLPEGFLERTAGKGRVVGWVPQTEVLDNKATGGFVSHCGWNSVLESLWYGIPVATWPMYSEQQLNAFQMVKDLGLGVEISLDYDQKNGSQRVVSAEVIERGIREVMGMNSEVRARVKEMQVKSRMALEEGGSSLTSLRKLVDDIVCGYDLGTGSKK